MKAAAIHSFIMRGLTVQSGMTPLCASSASSAPLRFILLPEPINPAKCPSLVDQRLGAPAGLLLEPGFERVGDGGGGGVAVGGFDGHRA